jgi:tether containing UBX domain for GLUT4
LSQLSSKPKIPSNMATNVKVVSTDLRQTTIKVDPETYLTKVLESACKKFSLSSDKYLLK